MDYTSSILENLTYVDAWKIINKIKKLNLIEINKAFRFITVLKDEIQNSYIYITQNYIYLVILYVSLLIHYFINKK